MNYIVVFNLGYRDPEFLTDYNGFIKTFAHHEDAEREAKKWIDGDGYRDFKIFNESEE